MFFDVNKPLILGDNDLSLLYRKATLKSDIINRVILFTALLLSIQSVFAGGPGGELGLFDMSLEELMDVSVVVSAARHEQKVSETSIALSTITAEDIHYSGLTTIPEILQLAPGVDVRRLNRYHYVIGVRGMMSTSADRTLVLIDGHTAMNSVFGPPDWLNLPVMIEDIERIEILRGPAGSAWGANAATGIINIITKKPSGELGSVFSTTISEYGDTYNHLRYTGAQDDWSWRISAGFENMENSDAAGAGKTESAFPSLNALMGFNSFSAHDFARISRFDTEFRRQYSPDTELIFGAAYSNAEAGDIEFVGYYPNRDNLTSTTRLFSRIEHTFDDSTTGYLQWFGNYISAAVPQMTNSYSYFENDLEAQINFSPNEEHSFTLGGNLRWTRFNYDSDPSDAVTFTQNRFDEYWAGFFVFDRLKLSKRLSLETQARIDYYSETQTDWSCRTTTLYSLDEDDNHVLRASFARSFRGANLSLRESRTSTLFGLFNVIAPPRPLENESTYAFEVGYTGVLDKSLILQVNSYYQKFDNILGSRTVVDGFGVSNSTFENLQSADTYGAECEITYKKERFELTSWYAFNEFLLDPADQMMRAHAPTKHKAGLRTRLLLDNNWALSANYTYNDSLANVVAAFPMKALHRVDVTLSHRFKNDRGEIMFGVSDLLNEACSPNYDVSSFTSYETPGRTFFTRLQLNF